ncbi:hypothetical protein Tco_0729366 [Tanacetum coccineum]|uniref:Uncharacterized protein n=1 Tax=Tanacetum coccineum TaxID=301880 RepID=A0ABQ4YP65_9ASTR
MVYVENSARLALTSEFMDHDAIYIDFPKAMYVLNDTNLIEIESQTLTWIEVDVTRPQRVGQSRQLEIHICGPRRNIDHAVRLITEREDQVREPEGPGAVDRAFKYLWGKAKAAYGRIKCW